MKHEDVARSFVDEITATGSRMFCEDTDEGFTVFSHGHHYAISRHTEYGFVFNSDGYSSSTSKHKSYVLRALCGIIIELPGCNEYNANEQLEKDKKEIEQAKEKLKHVRSDGMLNHWKEIINERNENIENIKKYILPKLALLKLEERKND